MLLVVLLTCVATLALLAAGAAAFEGKALEALGALVLAVVLCAAAVGAMLLAQWQAREDCRDDLAKRNAERRADHRAPIAVSTCDDVQP